MNSPELLNTLSWDQLQDQIVDYNNDFENFKKNKEEFELQKKTNLFDEKAQKEMELDLEQQKSELAIVRTELLTSLDTQLLKNDIDQTTRQHIEQTKKDITQKDPNSSWNRRETVKTFVSDTRSTTPWKIARIWSGILAFFWIKSLFWKKKKDKDVDNNEDKEQDENRTSSHDEWEKWKEEDPNQSDKTSDEDNEEQKNNSESKDPEEAQKDEDPINELNNQVDKVTEQAGKTINLFEKVGDLINKKAA